MVKVIFYILAIITLIISILTSALSFIINVNYLGIIFLICAYIIGILIVRVKNNKLLIIKGNV